MVDGLECPSFSMRDSCFKLRVQPDPSQPHLHMTPASGLKITASVCVCVCPLYGFSYCPLCCIFLRDGSCSVPTCASHDASPYFSWMWYLLDVVETPSARGKEGLQDHRIHVAFK